jgi:UDP-hydrolysing UDP-N-acetyl-D-glucosamine 2-epimerase
VRKICIVIGSRANYGRLKSVIKAFNDHPDLELQLITGASGIDLPIDTPDRIQCLVEGDNLQAMTLTTGLFLCQLGGVLERLRPDIVLVHGDRYEMLAVATAAAYMNIPLAHTEGGEISGTIDQKVRYAITALADIHFPVTEQAAKRILSAGADPDRVFTVGSTALDSLVGLDLTNNRKEPYILVLHHPNTTDPEDITSLIEAVNAIPLKKVWVNPNVDPGSKAMLKLIHRQNVEFVKHLPPEEYARLLYNCEVAVGNSSSFIKEGAFLGVSCVIVGNRQHGRERGNNVIFTGYDKRVLKEIVRYQVGKKYTPDHRFGNGTAGKKVAEILSKIEVSKCRN